MLGHREKFVLWQEQKGWSLGGYWLSRKILNEYNATQSIMKMLLPGIVQRVEWYSKKLIL